MAANDYYNSSNGQHVGAQYSRADPPTLPPLQDTRYASLRHDARTDSPISPIFDTTPLRNHPSQEHEAEDSFGDRTSGPYQASRHDSDEILLHGTSSQGTQQRKPDASTSQVPLQPLNTQDSEAKERRRRRRREREKIPFWSRKNTWVVYILTLIQAAVFIAELVKNGGCS